MKLTIGMAVYDDYDGVYFTIQALRMYHDMREVEIIVVNNNPTSESGKETAHFVEHKLGRFPRKHIPFTAVRGTAAPRELIFKMASGRNVLVTDPHVLFKPGAIDGLVRYMDETQTKDLIQGPMLHDDLETWSTHFDDQWRALMWGIWGDRAYVCKCGKTAFYPTVKAVGVPTTTPGPHSHQYVAPATHYAVIGVSLKGVPYDNGLPCGCNTAKFVGGQAGSIEDMLVSEGCKVAGTDHEPFEIQASGLGSFACRKDAWLGFNQHFRGFGGEEFYIHEKFRKAGRKTIFLPALGWLHRFGRPNGISYPLLNEERARNYIIGHMELGLSLKRCFEHFVGGGHVHHAAWDAIYKEASVLMGQPGECSPCQKNAEEKAKAEMMEKAKTASDFLKKWISPGVIVEFAVGRAEPSMIASAMEAGAFYSHAIDTIPAINGRVAKRGNMTVAFYNTKAAYSEPVACDTLILSEKIYGSDLLSILNRHGVMASKRILIGGLIYSTENNGDQPGILPAVRAFLKQHPKWTNVARTKDGIGWLVLSCLSEDKKTPPGLWQKGWNVLKATWRNQTNVLTDYGPLVGSESQEKRLELCTMCDSRVNGDCGECGCPLDKKTSHPKEFCPLGQWEAIDEKQE